MKTLLMTLSLQTLLLTSAHAGLKTRIVKVISPETTTEAFEVLVAKDRQIFTVNPSQTELLEELRRAEELNSVVELNVRESEGQDNHELVSLELLEEGDNVLDFYPSEGLHPMTNYTPSNVDGVDRATELFNLLREGGRWMSQCFNRAHLWSRQLDKDHGVKSMKILIYYTKKFRSEIGGKWWFHIAPMVDVNGEHYVLDKEFTREPVTEENWEHIFTRKMEEKGIYGYRCKVIQNISEYYDDYNQNNEYCNIQITSMYYWEPNDMSRLERTGEQQTEFQNRDLRIAAKNVYWRWGWKKAFNRVKVE